MNLFKSVSKPQRHALVVLGVSLAYLATASGIELGFFNGVISPKTWAYMVGAILVVLSVALWFEPRTNSADIDTRHFPTLAEWRYRLPAIVLILAYGLLLQDVGFAIVTPALVFVLAKQFGAPTLKGGVLAIALTAACFLLFDVGLDIHLPRGDLWGKLSKLF